MGRAPCCDKTKVKRGPWSPQEDNTLKNYVENYGTGGNWIALPQKAGLKRCGKSCRLRWLNYLRPNIKHGGFTEEEDNIILTLYHNIGSRWSVIASQLPGRTDNDVKNYWNTKLKKKLLLAATTTTTTATATAANKNSFTSSTNNYINLGTSSIHSRNDSKISPADDIIYHDDNNNMLLPYFQYHHQEMMASQIPLPSLTEIPENGVENAAYNCGLVYPCAPLMSQEEAAAFSVDNNIINGGGESASWSTNGSGEYDTFLAEMVSDYTFDFQEKFCDDLNFAYSQLANNISTTDDDHQQQSMFNQRL